jgi:hypothetical protein
LIGTFFLFINGCRHDLDQDPDFQAFSSNKNIENQKDNLARIVAAGLAKAMLHQEVRDFLKNESLKQFDGDYNFLFLAKRLSN